VITPTDFIKKFDKNITPRAAYEIAKFAMRELETTSETKLATAFLAGTIVHVARGAEMPDKSLRGVANFLNDPDRSSTDIITSMLKYNHDPENVHHWVSPSGHPTHTMPQIAFVARMMLDLVDWQRDRVVSTALSPLLHEVFTDELFGYEPKLD
jgi:hypothetical protein